MYRLIFELSLRRMDPERAHALAGCVLDLAGGRLGGALRGRLGPSPLLRTRALGRDFPSPFGLAAGFDKNGEHLDGLAALGFGHVEVGTVTPRPQPGNPRPRLYRLPADRALINRMGFNNLGAERVAEAIGPRRDGMIVGVNIGKNKDTPDAAAAADYERAARLLGDRADYLVVNVSSPNTPGLRGLQAPEALTEILCATAQAAPGTPLLVKIAPDLSDEAIAAIAGLVEPLGLAGVVAVNTTIAREGLCTSPRVVEAYGAGGLSGAPLAARSRQVLRRLRAELGEGPCIVSAGGVRDAEDVLERLAAGATLVQGYTAFLYEGPMWAARVNRGLERAAVPLDRVS